MPSLPKPRLRRAARTRGAVVTRRLSPGLRASRSSRAAPRAASCAGSTSTASGPPSATGSRSTSTFHPLDYEDLSSRNQRPKVDEYDDYLFVVLQFPRYDKQLGRLSAAEVDVFLGPDYVITVPNQPLRSLDYLFERCQADEELRDQLFGKGAGYLLYRIVDDAVDASFPMLRKMGNKLERLEDDIFEGRSSEVVRDIFNVKQEIINFRRVVRPMRSALGDLERTTKRYVDEDLDVYFDDINDASERVWDMLENFKEVVEALESTNESVLSHELNNVLRVLTAFSVVMLPLTLIASIFGMNVQVPVGGRRRRLLDRHRRHGRAAHRHAHGVPQARVPLTP